MIYDVSSSSSAVRGGPADGNHHPWAVTRVPRNDDGHDIRFLGAPARVSSRTIAPKNRMLCFYRCNWLESSLPMPYATTELAKFTPLRDHRARDDYRARSNPWAPCSASHITWDTKG